jgi:hypothetical protein
MQMSELPEDRPSARLELERAIAEERLSRLTGVDPATLKGTVELSSPIAWLVNGTALYHYTTSQGLIGLLGSRTIWATSLACMNDTSELNYARELYQRALVRRAENLDEVHSEGWHWLVLNDLNPAAEYTMFAACFSRTGDELSQWRAYGGGLGGFGLGVDLPTSLEGMGGWQQLDVIYDPVEQNRKLDEFITGALEAIKDDPEPEPDAPWPTLAKLQREAAYLLASIKHPAFAGEREVRLVQWRHRSFLFDIKWRASRSGVSPYLELHLAPPEGDRPGLPPLVDLVIGPTNDIATTRQSLDLILEQHGYTFRLSKSVRLRVSAAPLRAS